MPNINAYKSSTKRSSTFSSKQPTSINHFSTKNAEGSSQKMKLKRRIRSQKRAWKWCVPRSESLKENCSKCQYVSRRIGIACDNVRPSSELSSVGICEKHMRFARQLKQLFIAEQCHADQGDFIAPRVDEDGMINVSDDDETLATTSEWPWSEENLLYDPTSTDDRVNVALNSDVITEKELLLSRLATLESRLTNIKEYREILFERRSRFEVFLQERVAEETKKGKLVAETAKEKRLMRLLRASKRYDRWLTSKSSQAMRSQLLARIKQNEERNKNVRDNITEELMDLDSSKQEEQLDFFDVFNESSGNDNDKEQKHSSLCSFVYEEENDHNGDVVEGENPEETNSKTVEDEGHKKVKPQQCTNRAIPYLNYCIRHVFENANQQMFAACLECGAAALDFDDGEHYCFEHLSKKSMSREQLFGPLELKTSFDTATSVSTPLCSSVRASGDDSSSSNPIAQSTSQTQLSTQASAENLLSDKEENSNSVDDTSQFNRLSDGKQSNDLSFSSRLDRIELIGANSDHIQYEEEGTAPVKFVLIDDEDENETDKNDMATITTNFNNNRGLVGSSGAYSMNPTILSRRVSITARRRMDERNSSSARTRPFTPQYFIESKEKIRQRQSPTKNRIVSPKRLITIEQRKRSDEGSNTTSQTPVNIQKLRTAGQFSAVTSHSDLSLPTSHRSTTATPTNPDFMKPSAPTSTRSMITGGTSIAYSTPASSSPASTTSITRLTDPSTISLVSTVNNPTSAANSHISSNSISNTNITPSSNISPTADQQQQQLRTLSLPQSNRSALPQTSTQPALVRTRQIFSQQLMRQNASAQLSSEQQHQRTSSYSPYSNSSNLMSVGGQRWRPQQQPVSGARMQNTYRAAYPTYEMSDRAPISRTAYSDYRHQRDDNRVYPTAVPSSARSRLVPLDPSPNIYYTSQPTPYRSYIVPRPVRSFSRDQQQQQHSTKPSARRIPSIARHQQQASLETAAAVASIASLGDDSKPQDTQVAPSVSVLHQQTKQIDHSHQKVSIESAPGPSSSVSVSAQRVNIPSVHRRFPTVYHPNTSPFFNQKRTAERSDYSRCDTNNEQQMSAVPSSVIISSKPKILPSVASVSVRTDASVSRVVKTQQEIQTQQPLSKQQRPAGDSLEDGLSLLADTATASQSVVQSIVQNQRPTIVQTVPNISEADEHAHQLPNQSSSPILDEDDTFDLPKTAELIQSLKLPRELSADPVAAASRLINYGFELEDSD